MVPSSCAMQFFKTIAVGRMVTPRPYGSLCQRSAIKVGTLTSGLLPVARPNFTICPMKRIIAWALWFLVGGYVGAVIAWALNINAVVGPLLALALSGVVVLDPRHAIWEKSKQRP